jgi:hypothetical protein
VYNHLSRHSRLALLGGVLSLLSLFSIRVQAQGTSTATVVGTVTDSSGAAVVGATVQAKNVGTGGIQTAMTDAQGRYRIPNMNIGRYDIDASNPGFQPVVRPNITLTVGSEPVVDFTLQVGQAQQAITVQGDVSLVETQSAAVGALVESTQMRELPLNGRNYTQLIALEPGVTQIVTGAPAAGSSFAGNGVKYTIAGSRPSNTVWLLDGQDLLGWWRNVPGAGGLGSALGVEAIAEFQLLTNTYSTQFGGNGAVVNASSRSGTNDFHGSAFEFLRNNVMEARNFFDRNSPPAFRRNQFGGSIGGPIKKDKIFVFGNYEGLRSTQVITNIATVPDQCAHQFLSSTLTPGICGTPVARNPDPVIASAIANTMALWPNTAFNELPASGGLGSGTGQTSTLSTTIGSEDYYLARLDYNISEKDALFVRYIYDHANRTAPANATLPFWPEVDHSRGNFIQLQYRRIVSANIVNLARAGFDRPYEEATDVGSPTVSNGVVAAGDASVAGVHPLQFYGTSAGRVDGVIGAFSGVSSLGPACCLPFYLVPNRFSFGDDVIWTSGSHSIKLGATATRFRENTFTVLNQTPAWTFASLAAFEAGTPVSVAGQVSDAQSPQSGLGSFRDWRYMVYAFYAEDQWKIGKKLTANIGLRYAPTSIITMARRPAYMLLNPFAANQPWVPETQETEKNPSLKNWDPRIGLAYDPFPSHKTSIRAGFGVFHNVMYTSDLNSWFQPPLLFAAQTTGLTYPTPLTNIPAATDPNAVVIPTNGSLSIQGNGQYWGIHATAYQMQWNISLQQEIMANTVATVAYIGTHYVHGVGQTDINSPLPCVQTAGQVPSGPYLLQSATGCFYNGAPTYTSSAAPGALPNARVDQLYNSMLIGDTLSDAHYEGLQANLNRRFSRGFQAQVSYTFSKAIDNASGAFGPNGGGAASQTFNVAADRGLANFDRRNNFRVSAIYDIPYHKGGLSGALLSGWELTGIYTYLSGYPSNPSSAASRVFNGTGSPNGRPDVVAGCDLYSGFRTLNAWFNTSCFSLQALGTYGNAGRDIIIGPNLWNLDNSLIRDFNVRKISENFKIQFRAEAFNIFNHPSFQNPNTTIFAGGGTLTGPQPAGTLLNASAGRITGTTSSPRQIQLGLKIVF